MMPGDQKEAIHSLDKKNHQRGRNVVGKHRGFHRMGGGKWGSKRKIYYLVR